jgi:hypothetical protein
MAAKSANTSAVAAMARFNETFMKSSGVAEV